LGFFGFEYLPKSIFGDASILFELLWLFALVKAARKHQFLECQPVPYSRNLRELINQEMRIAG